MNAIWLRSSRLLCGSAFLILLAAAGAHAQSTHTSSASTDSVAALRLAEQQFKNIQVLKGIPADQLIPTMQFIAASLGVECEHCHVAHANEKDDKKAKLTARKMISMVMAINKDDFEGHREVTCYSCHRGSPDPVATPLITAEEPKPEPQPSEAKPVFPPAEELLDKYLHAIGGATALQKVTSRVQKGTLTFAGQQSPIDVFSKAPDKRLSVMHTPKGDSVTAFDGHQGWLNQPGRLHIMSAAENDAARIDADFYLSVHLKTMFQKLRVDAGEKIDSHDTYLVVGRTEGQPPLRLYFDKESGILLRLIRYAETPLGLNPTQIDYADYRDSGGVRVPFRWTLARPGTQFTIQVDQVQQNVPIDDAKFVAPPPPRLPPSPPAPTPANP